MIAVLDRCWYFVRDLLVPPRLDAWVHARHLRRQEQWRQELAAVERRLERLR